jgi:hypothetical protein
LEIKVLGYDGLDCEAVEAGSKKWVFMVGGMISEVLDILGYWKCT